MYGMYQVYHRLLLNDPLQRRDCELWFIGIGSFGRNMVPNLHAINIAQVIQRFAYALTARYFDKECRLRSTVCVPRCTCNRVSTSMGAGSRGTPGLLTARMQSMS